MCIRDRICTSFFTEELKIKRNLGGFHDSRVHACLYFITPNGHGLKSIDLVCMKKLDAKVNIIPIIAKADTINKTELNNFKVLQKKYLSFWLSYLASYVQMVCFSKI